MHTGRILPLEFHDVNTQNSGLDTEVCTKCECTDNSQKIVILSISGLTSNTIFHMPNIEQTTRFFSISMYFVPS